MSTFRVDAGIVRSTSRRTASPKRRRRSSSSMAMRRSSASSSSTVKSALRVTRKRCASSTSIPRNRSARFASMTWSIGMNRFGSTSRRRGRICGTLTRANTRSPVSGPAAPPRSTGSASRCTGTGGPGPPRAASGRDRSRRGTAGGGGRGARGPAGSRRSRSRRPRARRGARGRWSSAPRQAGRRVVARRRAAPRDCGRRAPRRSRRLRSAGAARLSGPGRTRRDCPRRSPGTWHARGAGCARPAPRAARGH